MSEINELHSPTINPISLIHYRNRGRIKIEENPFLEPSFQSQKLLLNPHFPHHETEPANLQSGFASRSEPFEETNLSRSILAPRTVNPLTESISGFQNPNSSPISNVLSFLSL
ncbi:hypothetical protein AMTRI_Chr04g250890 [Amborella trichopoda]